MKRGTQSSVVLVGDWQLNANNTRIAKLVFFIDFKRSYRINIKPQLLLSLNEHHKFLWPPSIGKKKFSLPKDYVIKVYPVTLEKPTLWVTNWFSLSPGQLKWMNGGNMFEEYYDKHWEYIRTLAAKMAEYHQNVAIISPIALGL